MHVHADGDGGVAAREAARRDDDVVHRGDVEAAVRGGDRGGEVVLALERVDAGVRERRVAVVLGGARRQLVAERLGQAHEARAARGLWR